MPHLVALIALHVLTAPPPPADAEETKRAPLVERWHDAQDVSSMMAQGSMDVCEALTLPIELIPEVGEIAGMALSWLCIIPGAYAADHVQRFRGTKDGSVWQATIGLAGAKLWRDATRIFVVVGLVAAGGGMLALATGASLALGATVWPAAPLLLPVAAAVVLTGAAATYVLIREARKKGSELIFDKSYELFTSQFADDEKQVTAQREAWVHPPFNVFERWWYLAAISAGAEAESNPSHWIPVVGPVLKAGRRADALRGLLRRISVTELREQQERSKAVDVTIALLGALEGGLAAGAHLALGLGAALAVGGVIAASAQLPLGVVRPPAAGLEAGWQSWAMAWGWAAIRGAPLAALTGMVGFVGVGFAGLAIGLIAARLLPKALAPIAVPLAWGVFPEGKWFPTRDEEQAARAAEERKRKQEEFKTNPKLFPQVDPFEQPAIAPAPTAPPASEAPPPTVPDIVAPVPDSPAQGESPPPSGAPESAEGAP